ncbi:hypothetical protein [Streptomyces soliscabiei]|uniref:hypothetical protein n=1 Tax=Streptomyces soliscabiei TaxID=588897 RepID=UPI0029B265CF|nr:hypothetical protein [Streptomyces sp. NY05-11A]MDX2675358.1 hypothetical protein [Streptomyces sp. NY05-11A]
MDVHQLPGGVREFASHLSALLVRLDQGAGWCAVFWQRDPDGMQACLDGREVPPWDVVEALLQDLAAEYGTEVAVQEAERVRPLHAAALAAHDARPGGRDALGDRLDVMLREQRYAAERLADLSRRLASAATHDQADAIRLDLAWAHDDHERATARCAELRYRMVELDRLPASVPRPGSTTTDPTPNTRPTTPTTDAYAARAGHGDAESAAGAVSDGYDPRSGFRAAGSAGGAVVDAYDAGAGHRAAEPVAGAVVDVHDARSGYGAAGPAAGAAVDAYDARSGFRAAGSAAGAVAGAYDARAGQRGVESTAGAAVGGYDDAGGGFRGAEAAGGSGGDAYDARAGYRGAESAAGATVDAYDAGAPTASAEETPAPAPAPVPKQRKRRRGSARFAGIAEEEDAGVPVGPPVAEPVAPAPAAPARRTPRGARFAGAAEKAERPSEPQREPLDAAARRETVEVVERLVRLRGDGRSGEAHALLVELAYWPAARIPLLAAELQRAGLTADWTTLLWEAASLPADRLVAAADALAAVGRTADGEQILRQGVARPAAEIGQSVLGLVAEGRRREARALLDAYVRVRTPEEAARSVAPDPQALVPLLLEAARSVSEERRWDLVHALRVAGFTA